MTATAERVLVLGGGLAGVACARRLADRGLVLADGRTLTGSHVVVAAGARPNFFGVPGAAEHAFPLYAVADAERLRLHLQALLRDAAPERSTSWWSAAALPASRPPAPSPS